MAENVQPATGGTNGDATAGKPFYEKTRQQLKALIERRKALEQKLANVEEDIYEKETIYLENTLGGNIITGFDSYTKGTTSAAAQRRKTGLTEANRVFSRSSMSYNSNGDATTPGSVNSAPVSHAPTPLSTSFANKDGGSGSNHPTPTSATATKAPGLKKSKKANEDSDADSRETKKMRMNFGAVRK